jgi:hypothetical protein
MWFDIRGEGGRGEGNRQNGGGGETTKHESSFYLFIIASQRVGQMPAR